MKQVVVKKGLVMTEEIPMPKVDENRVLVKIEYSCISAGTEMMGVEQSGKSIIKKAIEQPQKIVQAFDMYKTNGLAAVLTKVDAMSASKETGYSAAGTVIAVGKNIKDIQVGMRVAVAGAGCANHAEIVSVPRNLTMIVPDGLNLKEASTVTMGGIAMQGVRRLKPELGETIAVVGLGLLGQLAVQILTASGCHVIGVDFDTERTKIAKENGCEYVFSSIAGQDEKMIKASTLEYGVDGVLITAATHSSELLNQCFNLCRKKGRVVLVGVVDCVFDREMMYAKELDFYISTSYGPGRYDEQYEERGIDYPYAYVRWTENRNMLEYLNMLAVKRIQIENMISSIFKVDDAKEAYAHLRNPEKKPLITLLEYPRTVEEISSCEENSCNEQTTKKEKDKLNVALVGAGGFAKATHLPNLAKLKTLYNIYAIMSTNGVNAKNIAEQYEAQYYTTDYERILKDENVDVVIICTRHHLHAQLAIAALQHNKSVLLEKPLAMNENELMEIKEATAKSKGCFMIGYNRRFSPIMKNVKRELENHISPMIINYQMNAGYIPMDSWVHSEEGGGRVIGELCHIVDLCSYIVDEKIESISVNSIKNLKAYSARDNVVVTIKYDDGSLANLLYTAVGDSKSGKELCDIYCDKKTIRMFDYKTLDGYGVKFKDICESKQDKGHIQELQEFYNAVRNGIKFPIDWDVLENTSRVTFTVEKEIIG